MKGQLGYRGREGREARPEARSRSRKGRGEWTMDHGAGWKVQKCISTPAINMDFNNEYQNMSDKIEKSGWPLY